ncbi:MAG: zinc-ribbon domain-containing protein [Caldilineae bacterium]|nr:MAG: zinc-ribbon domain-containing protein [Caldilineae bacterium]
MLAITLLIGLLIALAVALFVVRPLLEKDMPEVLVEDDRLTELVSRKDATLRAIKDLEFDYLVGKVSEEDFQRFNERLRRQAMAYMRQIETLAPESAHLDETLEAQIARLRKTKEPLDSVRPKDGVPSEAGDAPVAAEKTGPGRFCTSCGQPVEPTHKFCAHCGAPIAVPAESR